MEMTDEERLMPAIFLAYHEAILYVANVDEDMLTEPAPVINGVWHSVSLVQVSRLSWLDLGSRGGCRVPESPDS